MAIVKKTRDTCWSGCGGQRDICRLLVEYRLAWPTEEWRSIKKKKKIERKSESQRDNGSTCSSQLHLCCQDGKTDGCMNGEMCSPWNTDQPLKEGNPASMAT